MKKIFFLSLLFYINLSFVIIFTNSNFINENLVMISYTCTLKIRSLILTSLNSVSKTLLRQY